MRSPRLLESRWLRCGWWGHTGRLSAVPRLADIPPHYTPPLSTGENLFPTQDVENLIRFGGLPPDRNDVIQVDPPQSYGIVQYARTIDMLASHGWPRRALFPHGGNQMSLAMAAGFGLGGAETSPGRFGAVGGFARAAPLGGRDRTPSPPAP